MNYNTYCMKKLLEIVYIAVLACAGIVALLFFVNNLEAVVRSPMSSTALLVLVTISVLLFVSKSATQTIASVAAKVYSSKHFTLVVIGVAIVLGLIVRLYFFTHFSYAPISDPSTFYEAARKIAEGKGMTGDTYAAFFPYLAAYNGLLGLATHLVADPWLAVIVLNFTLDIITGILIFVILKLVLTKQSFIPTLGSILWILSPFTILFSLISIPIAAVNLFITLAVYLSLLVLKFAQKSERTSFLLASLSLGLALGIGNAFRPLFIIFIIALCLAFIYIALTAKKRTSAALFLAPGFALIVVTYLLLQQVGIFAVHRATNLEPASNSSGWSIFVGANRESSGKWNIEDEGRMAELCQNLSRDDCHDELKEAGIARLSSYGLFETLELFTQKLYIFSSDQDNVYNADTSIVGYRESSAWKLFHTYTPTYFIFILSFVLIFFYGALRQATRRPAAIYLFLSLLIIGIFFSTALVETSARYAQVIYPIFTILACAGIGLVTRLR